jgi:hypothetical protein
VILSIATKKYRGKKSKKSRRRTVELLTKMYWFIQYRGGAATETGKPP